MASDSCVRQYASVGIPIVDAGVLARLTRRKRSLGAVPLEVMTKAMIPIMGITEKLRTTTKCSAPKTASSAHC